MDSLIIIKAAIENWVDQKWVINRVSLDVFEDQYEKILWKILKEVSSKYGNINSYSSLLRYIEVLKNFDEKLVDNLKNKLSKIESIQISESDIKLSFDIIDSIILRHDISDLISILEKGIQEGHRDKIISEINRWTREKVGIKTESSKEIFDDIYNRELNNLIDTDDLSTGIYTLDRILNGGLKPGTLSVILGSTSIGKTMFLIYLSAFARIQGKKVWFLSLEDADHVVFNRFDSLFLGKETSLKEKVLKKEWLDKFEGKIWVDFVFGMQISELEERLKYMKESKGIDVLVVDYGDLLYSKKKGEEWVEQGEIFQELMRMSEKYQITLITASQANRNSINAKNLTLAHVGQSFRKVQVAHYVLALAQSEEEEKKNLLRVIVLKNKFGLRGIGITLSVDRERHWFRELESTIHHS